MLWHPLLRIISFTLKLKLKIAMTNVVIYSLIRRQSLFFKKTESRQIKDPIKILKVLVYILVSLAGLFASVHGKAGKPPPNPEAQLISAELNTHLLICPFYVSSLMQDQVSQTLDLPKSNGS